MNKPWVQSIVLQNKTKNFMYTSVFYHTLATISITQAVNIVYFKNYSLGEEQVLEIYILLCFGKSFLAGGMALVVERLPSKQFKH
jgi:capsule polysaccharide export protein KpsC/LpsZ